MTRLPSSPLFIALALCLWAAPDRTHAKRLDDPLSDNSVRYAVEVKLTRDPVVFSHDLDARVEDGIVILEGHVQNLVMKERAVRLAKTRRGVLGVVDRLEVRPLIRSDEQIADGVRHAIENAPLHEAYENVAVSVENGAVFLDGAVPSGIQRQLVGSIAAGILGVRDIENRISIDQDNLGDEEIRTMIEARLRSDFWLANSDIEANVEDGSVVLKGSVVSDALRQRAAQLSWVRGTERVLYNQIEVNPLANNSSKAPLTRSDDEIAEAIEAAWKIDPRIDIQSDLRVHVLAGEATIQGHTPRLTGLTAAADDARNVFGVTRVVNLAKVRPSVPVADDTIENLIATAIKNDAILSDFKDSLMVTVQNGRAEFLGLVENDFHKLRANKLASRVAGVKQIRNGLKTEMNLSGSANSKRPIDDRRTPPTDAELEQAIESEIYWNWKISLGSVGVNVDDGVAVLSGEVANLRAQDAALDAALDAGAPSVINSLTIRENDTTNKTSGFRDETNAPSGDSKSQ